MTNFARIIELQLRRHERTLYAPDPCGDTTGGFQPGNTCATGGHGGGQEDKGNKGGKNDKSKGGKGQIAKDEKAGRLNWPPRNREGNPFHPSYTSQKDWERDIPVKGGKAHVRLEREETRRYSGYIDYPDGSHEELNLNLDDASRNTSNPSSATFHDNPWLQVYDWLDLHGHAPSAPFDEDFSELDDDREDREQKEKEEQERKEAERRREENQEYMDDDEGKSGEPQDSIPSYSAWSDLDLQEMSDALDAEDARFEDGTAKFNRMSYTPTGRIADARFSGDWYAEVTFPSQSEPKEAHLELFITNPASRGKHVGMGTVTKMIDYLKAQKADIFSLYAYKGNWGNGYITWPLMGFDGDLPYHYRQSLPQNLKGAKKVSDLMMTEDGREWWRDNGDSIELEFDLHDGSRSWDILNRYKEAVKNKQKLVKSSAA